MWHPHDYIICNIITIKGNMSLSKIKYLLPLTLMRWVSWSQIFSISKWKLINKTYFNKIFMSSYRSIIKEGIFQQNFHSMFSSILMRIFHSWNAPLKPILTKASVHWRKNRTLLYRFTRQFLWREETPFLQVILLNLIKLWAVQWYLLWRISSKSLSSSSLIFLANMLWTILRKELLLFPSYLCTIVRKRITGSILSCIRCAVFLSILHHLTRLVKGRRTGFSVWVFNVIREMICWKIVSIVHVLKRWSCISTIVC